VKNTLIIIRYGEIALKAKQTRRRFENTLVNNIKEALGKKNIDNKLRREWGRIYVYSDQIEKCVSVLQKVFGITSISPAIETDCDINSISKIAKSISKEKIKNEKSFAVRVKRTGNHDFTSQDIAIKIGNEIVNETKAKVDLTNPDFELFIEIRNDIAYFFNEKIKGYGGMPIGSQGNILAFIDTPYAILASWYLIHRGCKPIFLFTNEIKKGALEKFMNYWFINSKIIEISTKKNLYEQINMAAAENHCDAIISGLTIYDDSDNFLTDIKHLKKQITLPVLHPLLAMDTKEIKGKLREIGLVI
jgi:thiamine biosynthesis protein ThiI